MSRFVTIPDMYALPWRSAQTIPPALFRQLRRADTLTQCTVMAAQTIWERLDGKEAIPPEFNGIFLGTGHGPLETGFAFLGDIQDNDEGQGSPTLFSHSVHGVPAGYVAWILQVLGPIQTITSFTWPLLTALFQAMAALKSGRIRRALVLSAELPSPFLKSYMPNSPQKIAFEQWGAVVWVLEGHDTLPEKPLAILDEISITELPCDPLFCLSRAGEVWPGHESHVGPISPISYAFALTEAVSQWMVEPQGIFSWPFSAPFGKGEMRLHGSIAKKWFFPLSR